MSNTRQTTRVTRRRSDTLLPILETLPGAFFILDETETIVYANARAQAMRGAPAEALCGNSFWRCAPHLVSPALYQAVRTTKQTQALTEVQYVSPVTQRWLHVQLAPTVEGLILQFYEGSTPARHQETSPQSELPCLADLDGLPTRIGILTPEGIVLDITAISLDDAQVRREEVIGKPLAEAPWWSSVPLAQRQLRVAIEQASRGETAHFETHICPQPERCLDLAVTLTPQHAANQQVEYLICTGLDITRYKRVEEELRTLVDTLPQFVWIRRPDGSIAYSNRRWHDYAQRMAEQDREDEWFQHLAPVDQQCVQDLWHTAPRTGSTSDEAASLLLVHPEDRERVLALQRQGWEAGEPYEFEYRLRDGRMGAYRWFLSRGVPLRNEEGQIVRWVGTCTDIDDQKRAEQKIKASEENLRVLAETLPQLVWIVRPDGQHEYTNQRSRDYTGLTLEQIQSNRWAHLQFIHPDDHEGNRVLWQHALDTGEMYEYEERLRNGQTGTYRWFLVRGTPVRDDTGQIIKWFGTSTDIEDRKRIEEALRQSQKRVNVLMNSSLIGINILEGEQIVDANETFLRMTGYTREDLCAGRMNVMHMTPPEYLARTQQAHQELAIQQSITYEKEYVCKDGSRLPVIVSAVVLKRHPFQGIAFVLDNSAHKELEQRKDAFISMASHELKTPLTAVKMQTQLVRKRLEKQSQHEAATELSRVEGPVKQLERLIGELLDVSKIQAGRLEYVQEPVDLEVLLHEVAETMQQMSPTHTIVVRGAAPYSLIGDQGRLEQVFTNLISNAIKYSLDAKTVEIDLSTSEETVTIRVTDHGLGIPRGQRDKIFERFYRVTDLSQRRISGLGMGLYIVAEIVKGHGGTITVDSEVGKGSTFTVTLPTRREA